MITLNRIESIIPALTGFGVLIIAASAFLLSYTNLYEAAVEAGIPVILAPLWPLNLDVFLVVGSLYILRTSLRNEDTKPGWIIVIFFTIISCLFNVIHSPDNFVSRFSHLIPPVALCISLEMAMLIIRSDLQKNCRKKSPDPIKDLKPVEKLETRKKPGKSEVVKQYFTDNPESTISQAAIALNIDRSTVRKYKVIGEVNGE